jgi:hypothetical protein
VPPKLGGRRTGGFRDPAEVGFSGERTAGNTAAVVGRTFLIPSGRNAPHLQIVCAVRTDVAPDAPEGRTDRLWWRRVDDLPVTIETWRAMLRRTARRERIAIRTFLHPPTCAVAGDLTGQLIYAMWINQPEA